MMTFMPDISADPRDVDHWKKDTTRQAILAAARRLSAREGVDAVTLGQVAAEAGFAATVVYTYFVTKDDLHLALVADDLETIAAVMRDGSGARGDESVVSGRESDISGAVDGMAEAATDAEVDTETLCDASPQALADLERALGVVRQGEDDFLAEPGSEPEPIPDAFPEDAVGEADATVLHGEGKFRLEDVEAAPSSLPVLAARPGVVTHVKPAVSAGTTDRGAWVNQGDFAARLAQLQACIERLEHGPVDAELERRLDSIERSLSVLETRMERVEQDAIQSRTRIEEDRVRLTNQLADALGASHRSLLERSEQHAVVVGDMRAYVKELTGRVSAIENWLARTVRLATGENARGTSSLLTREQDDVRADAATGHEGFAASTRTSKYTSARSHRTPWLIAPILVLLLVIGALGATISLHLLPREPAAGSSVATMPARSSVDARVMAMAKAGSAKAELVAGLNLLNGDGVAPDVPSAAYWLRKAALQNQPVAEYWLATLYERGRGVPKDLAQAMQWYAKAAAAGNAKAMYRLAVAYVGGWGGTPDYVAAARWFADAAQYGSIDAQFNLAVLYERGSGVPMSLKNAFTWYAIAAAQGDAQSKARLDVLAAHMSASDLQAAQAAASAFKVLTPVSADNDEPDPAELARHL